MIGHSIEWWLRYGSGSDFPLCYTATEYTPFRASTTAVLWLSGRSSSCAGSHAAG